MCCISTFCFTNLFILKGQSPVFPIKLDAYFILSLEKLNQSIQVLNGRGSQNLGDWGPLTEQSLFETT